MKAACSGLPAYSFSRGRCHGRQWLQCWSGRACENVVGPGTCMDTTQQQVHIHASEQRHW